MFEITEDQLKLFKPTDIMLPSYPRSGSTWTRLLFSDIVMQLHGIESNAYTVYDTKSDSKRFDKKALEEVQVYRWIALNAYETDLQGVEPPLNLPFRLIMSHYLYSPRLNFKTLYLFRNPYDVLCSYYHLCLSYRYFGDDIPSIDEFCQGKRGLDGRNALQDYCNHLSGYISFKRENPEKAYFLSYQSLYRQPVSTLMGVFQFCGLNANPTMCRQAATNLEFNKLKSSHAKVIEKVRQQGGIEGEFFRKGKPGMGKEELSEESIALIQEQAVPLYQQALELETQERHCDQQFLSWVDEEFRYFSEFDNGCDLACKVPPKLIFLRLEVQQKAAKITQLEQKNEQLEQKKSQLEQTNEEIRAELLNMELVSRQLKDELQSSQDEVSQVKQRLVEIEKQLEISQGNLVRPDNTSYREHLKLKQKQDKIQHLRHKLQAKQEELQEAYKRLQNARGTISTMKQSKLWKLQSFWSQLRSRL